MSGGPHYQLQAYTSSGYDIQEFSSQPTVGDSYPYEIEYVGSDDWGVYVNNSQVATISEPDGSYATFAGIGPSGNTSQSESFSGQTNNSLEYLSSSDTWNHWSGGSIVNDSSSIYSASYSTKYYDETDSEVK